MQGQGRSTTCGVAKKAASVPACSHHGASPALNKFKLVRVDASPSTSSQNFAGNFLFTEIADGGISLVPYRLFLRVDILNLASALMAWILPKWILAP